MPNVTTEGKHAPKNSETFSKMKSPDSKDGISPSKKLKLVFPGGHIQ